MAALLSNTAAYAAKVLRGLKVKAREKGEGPGAILSARGTFYLVKLSDTYGPGIYSIDELTRITGRSSEYWKQNSPILLTSIEFNQVDITSQVPCLNNVKVFYSFGQNFGQVVIQGEVLLGPLGDLSYTGVERLVSFFWKNRVSVKHSPVAVSVADNAYFVYLTGLRVGQVNPDFHVMPFVMFGTLLDITRENVAKVNVRGQVFTGGAVNEPSLFVALQQMPAAAQIVAPSIGGITEEVDRTELGLGPGESPASYAGTIGDPVASQVQKDLNKADLTKQQKDLQLLKRESAKAKADLAQLKHDAGVNTPHGMVKAKVDIAQANRDAANDPYRTRGTAIRGDTRNQSDVVPVTTPTILDKIAASDKKIAALDAAVATQESIVVRADNLDKGSNNSVREITPEELTNLDIERQKIMETQAANSRTTYERRQ